MGEAKKKLELVSTPIPVLLDPVVRGLLIVILRQGDGKGAEYSKNLAKTLAALLGDEDWSHLEAGGNLLETPEGFSPKPIDLTGEIIKFLLDNVWEKATLRGATAEKLASTLVDLEDAKAGRYELPGEAVSNQPSAVGRLPDPS